MFGVHLYQSLKQRSRQTQYNDLLLEEVLLSSNAARQEDQIHSTRDIDDRYGIIPFPVVVAPVVQYERPFEGHYYHPSVCH